MTQKTTFNVRGHVVDLVCVDKDWDVKVSKIRNKVPEVLVVGMYGAGCLELSEYSPDGKKVHISDSLFEALSDEIEERVASFEDEDNSENEGD